MSNKAPNVGDKVVYRMHHINAEYTGVVDQILSTQFCMDDGEGWRGIVPFDADWEVVSADGKVTTNRKRGRMATYEAWVAYRREHLQGRGAVRATIAGEELSWSDAIYHASCPTTLSLIFKDSILEEEHSLEV